MYKWKMLDQMFLEECDQLLERIYKKAIKKAWLEGDKEALQRYQKLLNEVQNNDNTSTDQH